MDRLKKGELEKRFGESGAGEITPDPPGTVYVIARGRAPTVEEIVSKYMSQLGRKGGKIGGRIGGRAKTPAKKRASRNNGRLGGRPRKDQNQCLSG